MKNLTASDRRSLIRLASGMPKGSPERRAILAGLNRFAFTQAGLTVPDRAMKEKAEQVLQKYRRLHGENLPYVRGVHEDIADEVTALLVKEYADDPNTYQPGEAGLWSRVHKMVGGYSW